MQLCFVCHIVEGMEQGVLPVIRVSPQRRRYDEPKTMPITCSALPALCAIGFWLRGMNFIL